MDVVFQPLQCIVMWLGYTRRTLGNWYVFVLGIGIYLFWELGYICFRDHPPRHPPEDTSNHKRWDEYILGPSCHTPEHSYLLRPWTQDGGDSIWNSEFDRETHERNL